MWTHLRHFFAGRRLLFGLWLLSTVGVLIVSARLAVFMFAPAQAWGSMMPENDFMRRHSCFSAYVAAADLLAEPGVNIYDPAHYPRQADDATRRIPLGDFEQDKYEYPPTFLLVPRALVAVSRDFATLRGIWFVLETTAVLGALSLIAAFVGGRKGLSTALLIPLSWGALSSLLALQSGNVQLVIYAITILAMLAFEAGRPAAGGAMLAFAAATKLYPGLFLLVLLVQRRWRDALWTLGFGLLYCAALLALAGPGPMRDFVTFQLPRLMNAEAFDFFKADAAGKAANYSVYGLPYRFEILGLLANPDRIAPALGRIYTVLVVGAALFVGWKAPRPSPADDSAARATRVILWMALLNLAALRAPFLPPYGFVGTLWMLAVWAPYTRTFTRAAALYIPSYLLLTILPPVPEAPAVIAGTVAIFLDMGLNLGALRAALGKKLREDEPSPAEASPTPVAAT